jgi:hypothetical protein
VLGKKFTLIGTPQGNEIKDPSRSSLLLFIKIQLSNSFLTELEFLPDVVNDLDVDFSDNPAAAATYKNDQRNIRKVKEATKKLTINIIYPLREGKKLLVLDIDYSRVPLSCADFNSVWTCPSHIGYQAPYIGGPTTCGMRPTSITRVLGSHISLLWYMYMVSRLRCLLQLIS